METYSRLCPICRETEITYNHKGTYLKALRLNTKCFKCRAQEINRGRKGKIPRGQGKNWKSPNEIPFSWFSKFFLRSGCQKTGDITIDDVYSIWMHQNKKCNLSGLPIGFFDDDNKHTCSIDRIDSNLGYTLDNIHLVHKDVNIMKNKYDLAYFVNICKLIANK